MLKLSRITKVACLAVSPLLLALAGGTYARGSAPSTGPGGQQGRYEISEFHLPTAVGGEGEQTAPVAAGDKGNPVPEDRCADARAVPQQGGSSNCQQDV